MLIPFDELIKNHNIKPLGVFHIGASIGQEIQAYYKNGIQRSIWVEAIPEIFAELKKNIAPFQNTIAFNECVSDIDGTYVDFNISSNNGESSSILELLLHKKYHPDVRVVKTIKCVTKTIDTLILENGIELNNYEFLNIDLQGAELLALKGMKNNLHKIKYAYIEVNKEELYVGCALVEQIDKFLFEYGFVRVETKWTGWSWGDALYINNNNGK